VVFGGKATTEESGKKGGKELGAVGPKVGRSHGEYAPRAGGGSTTLARGSTEEEKEVTRR